MEVENSQDHHHSSERTIAGASKYDPECPKCEGTGKLKENSRNRWFDDSCDCHHDYYWKLDALKPSEAQNDCQKCSGFGIVIDAMDGETRAEVCQCTEGCRSSYRSELQNAAKGISEAGLPPLFANMSYKGKSFEEIAPLEIQEWLTRICKNKHPSRSDLMFLCGSVGNGKTHMAVDCVKRFILRSGRTARFLAVEDLISAKRDSEYFATRQDNRAKQHLEYIERVVKYAGLLVIDEVGRSRIPKYEQGVFEQFVDQRYQSGLPTLVISNHTFRPETSLEGIIISKVVGERAADRLREFVVVELNGPSKRRMKDPADARKKAYSESEIMEYKLPASVLAQQKGEMQILNWITRNPVFEPIRDSDRTQAVDDRGELVFVNNVPIDASREVVKVEKDVWQRGDQLVVDGPVLSGDDAKIYATCLDLLRYEHRSNRAGLKLQVTFPQLLEALRVTDSNDSRVAVQRSLQRLSRANITYSDNLGRYWTGALLNLYYSPRTYGDAFVLHFNESMIEFYRDFEYTKFPQRLFDAQIGTDGLRMQLFLRSHRSEQFDLLDFDGWMRFLGKPVREMDSSTAGQKLRRQSRKKFSELINKQIKAGLLTEDSALKRGARKISLRTTKI